ncbi:hypothetical protein M2333_003140 [Sphingobium sp. B11D3B]|uniref:putative Ig domain-containing protein n=1 Tax=Sphingobium sp. B11D3B TaxID=2940575 RepID=UPI002225D1F8|nr:putative Ig domain-containing protein [Sphingobium sp. B11D3B]MCW2390094.1 hypothetical protein [Sphingobium sp. B11D3B]
MATTSKYIIMSTAADNSNIIDFGLNYGTLSLDGQEMQFLGSALVDAVFVRPGATYSLSMGAGADRIYFEGALADYTLTRSGATLTLTRTAQGKVETVSLAGANSATTPDVLVFSDGTVAANAVYNHVSKGDPLPVPSGETSVAPSGPAAPAAVLSATVKVVSFDGTGETIALSKPGMKFQVLGNAGVDVVYVSDGATVDASALGNSTDIVYMRGHWADYTKVVSGSKMTLTRTVGGQLETVVVSAAGNALNDLLVFADGAVRSQVAGTAVKADANVAIAAISGYDATTITPGLNEAPVLAEALVDQMTVEGQAFTYSIAAGSFTDPDGDALTYTAQLVDAQGNLSALPSWLSFDGATGTFSSTSAPALASPITVRVTASDGSLSASDDFTIEAHPVPLLSTNVDGVTNLDVRSDLVFTSSEDIALTAVDGVYEIKIVNDANTSAKAGYSGSLGEAIDNTQTLVVTVVDGEVSATWNGATVAIADVLTISGDKLIINPKYDLDFSNNYHVEIDAGLLVSATSGLGNAALLSGATFSTVTPNTSGTGAALVTGAAASQTMVADGSLTAGHKWVGLDGIGNTAVSAATSIGSLAADGYALIVTDRDDSSVVGTWDFWVRATNFGADDLVYLDNQHNGTSGWDLASTSFGSGDAANPNDTRVDFGTYSATAPFPNSSQAWIDLDIGGEWQDSPAAAQAFLQSQTALFVGG